MPAFMRLKQKDFQGPHIGINFLYLELKEVKIVLLVSKNTTIKVILSYCFAKTILLVHGSFVD